MIFSQKLKDKIHFGYHIHPQLYCKQYRINLFFTRVFEVKNRSIVICILVFQLLNITALNNCLVNGQILMAVMF